MGGGYRQAEDVGHADGAGCGDLCRHALGVGHALLADLLADGQDHALPADHGAQAQRYRYGDLHPQRDEARGVVDLLLEQLQLALGVSIEMADLALVHQANGFAGQVHVVAHVAHVARAGNTPTGVGKTKTSPMETQIVRKHPHGRGEDANIL